MEEEDATSVITQASLTLSARREYSPERHGLDHAFVEGCHLQGVLPQVAGHLVA